MSLKNEKMVGQNGSSYTIAERDAERWKNFQKAIRCISILKNENYFLLFDFEIYSIFINLWVTWLLHWCERVCVCVSACVIYIFTHNSVLSVSLLSPISLYDDHTLLWGFTSHSKNSISVFLQSKTKATLDIQFKKSVKTIQIMKEF